MLTGGLGREGTPVEPGDPISVFISDYVPAGQTFAVMHDEFVWDLTAAGVPDLVANVPTMPYVYYEAFVSETANSLKDLAADIWHFFIPEPEANAPGCGK